MPKFNTFFVDRAGIVLDGDQIRTTEKKRRIIGRQISKLLMYPSEIAQVMAAIECAISTNMVVFATYTVDDLCFAALVAPNDRDTVKLYEAPGHLYDNDKRRVRDFLWKKYYMLSG